MKCLFHQKYHTTPKLISSILCKKCDIFVIKQYQYNKSRHENHYMVLKNYSFQIARICRRKLKKKTVVSFFIILTKFFFVIRKLIKHKNCSAAFYAPAICNGGHIASPLSVRTYVRKMVSGRYLLNTLVHWIYISYTGI